MLLDAGEKKINVIKEVRAITGLGLKEPRTWSRALPGREGRRQQAEGADLKKKLEEAGAKVELK